MATLQQVMQTSDLVRRAYDFAKKAHQGQKRKNGEPYLTHVVAAADHVAEWGLDEATVAAALLHDIVEDTGHTVEELKNAFSEEVAFLVDGVTKIKQVHYRGVEEKVENFRKFILYLSQDIRVILVRLADRLHNMKTLYALNPLKQKRIALETMEIFAPLAYRLGMQKLSGELEDLAFPYIYPEEHRWLMTTVRERFEEREKYAQKMKPLVEYYLRENSVPLVKVDSRAKHYASLYKKLLRYDMNLEHIHDLVALRVIVPSVEDCYAALGVVHKVWPPVPGRFKDYIALPKPNGYRSLHTTVFGPDQKIAEIQIRTQQMHEESEYGIAAHFAYQQAKDTASYIDRKAVFADKKELAWIQQLRNWQHSFSNEEEFLQSLKIDFFKDRILAMTPKGEVIDLPDGSTPVDFAYQIHTEVGNSCSGAKVNGRIAQLNTALHSGDVVEILTQKGKRPSEDWLEFVKTTSAKNHIRTALRHAPTPLVRREPGRVEFRLVAEDGMGVLKDVSTVFSRMKINIGALNTKVSESFHGIKVSTPSLPKDKIEKLLVKLKAVKAIKEVSYKLV